LDGANRLAPRGLRAAATGVAAGWDWGTGGQPLASGCDLLVECRGLATGRVSLRGGRLLGWRLTFAGCRGVRGPLLPFERSHQLPKLSLALALVAGGVAVLARINSSFLAANSEHWSR
jgi:hypothetical protein